MSDLDAGAPIELLRFTGEDRAGLTAELTAAMCDAGDVVILDLNQAVIHELLLLGMVVRMPADAAAREAVGAAVAGASARLGMRVRRRVIEPADYDRWVEAQGRPRSILTLLARRITAAQLAAVSAVVAEQGLNIDVIHRLSGRPPRVAAAGGAPTRACIEFSLRGTPNDKAAMHAAFMKLGGELALDVAWQKDDAYRRMRRMVVFDMDSTLIRQEVIDELAKEAGAGEQVAAVTAAAMRGEIEFDESLRRRVATLAGLPVAVLDTVADRLELTEGCATLMENLRAFGYRTAVLSGGFDHFGRHLQRRLGLDHVHANTLEVADGLLTGRVTGPIVNGARKAELLDTIAAQEGIHRRQVIAIGDGANDLPMLERAGLGIAFHAKPRVRAEADQAVSTLGLDALLYLIGVRDRERA